MQPLELRVLNRELLRSLGNALLESFERLAQLTGHVVERAGEGADLIGGGDRRLLSQISGCNLRRRSGDRQDRVRDPPCESVDPDARQEDHHEANDDDLKRQPARRGKRLGRRRMDRRPPVAMEAPIPLSKPDVGSMDQGTAQDQYNNAFGLLRQRDLTGAETAFKAFLQRHPKDPLAPNAQYWLGETYYSRENYAAAAATFAEGYQKYPQSGKAPEALLKLGMSLGNEGRTHDACLSFVRLEHEFPNLASGLKERADSERQRLGC